MLKHDNYLEERNALVATLQAKGIQNQAVLRAIQQVPRHLFVPTEQLVFAYNDMALQIGSGQTISQPYVVARMSEAMLGGRDIKNCLEIGTGSLYQAAVLSELVDEVYTVERIKRLYESAKKHQDELHIKNIHIHYGDGYQGWVEHAPYEGIIVTAATAAVPQALLEQLADGGCLVIPVGEASHQDLQLITRHGDEYTTEFLDPVMFVPMLKGEE